MARDDGLTEHEGAVMDALMDAVDAYNELPVQHPDEEREFIAAVHAAQNVLAVRLARRTHPKGWPSYGDL